MSEIQNLLFWYSDVFGIHKCVGENFEKIKNKTRKQLQVVLTDNRVFPEVNKFMRRKPLLPPISDFDLLLSNKIKLSRPNSQFGTTSVNSFLLTNANYDWLLGRIHNICFSHSEPILLIVFSFSFPFFFSSLSSDTLCISMITLL